MGKRPLRQKMLALRLKQQARERKNKSNLIAETLFCLPWYARSRNIMVYFDFKGEVSTGSIIRKSRRDGKKVLFPYIVPGNKRRELEVFELNPKNKGFINGHFGIPEPADKSIKTFPFSAIKMVLVPGIAFDYKGFRVGFGGGYYDRFLKLLPKNTIKVGLAFDWQLVGSIPRENHDIGLDLIVTDKQILTIRRSLLKNL